MMVVHEENKKVVERSVIRQPLLEQKSYVIVSNHVRELMDINTSQNKTSCTMQTTENEAIQNKSRKSDKLQNKPEEMPTTSYGSNLIRNNPTEIEPSDLEELKIVYKKCKEVMKRIETKYGHLLDLDEPEQNRKRKKQKLDSETSQEDCKCPLNKKIVFDDDGRQIPVGNTVEKHHCVKRTKLETMKQSIIIEDQDNIILPDSLQELGDMLHDPNIEKTHRNKVLQKIKSLKQDYINEIKFNKHILIEKLKSNPDEVLDFKGTNLSILPGYS